MLCLKSCNASKGSTYPITVKPFDSNEVLIEYITSGSSSTSNNLLLLLCLLLLLIFSVIEKKSFPSMICSAC
jgi:hypothetical protein